LAELVLALIVGLFAAGVVRQFGQLSQRALLLDSLGILPQWKFFGQSRVAREEGEFDDYHLLARQGTGGWQEVLCFKERTLLSALWNPGDLAKLTLAEPVVELGRHGQQAMTSLPYLIVLRHCLDRQGEGEAVQFAVVTTRGRGEQEPQLAFLSAWHNA
jgi:hypothetical protein